MMSSTLKPNLFVDGAPRYVRCYDDGGKSFDRYTVVFTGRYRRKTGNSFWYVGMSEHPFHPQGFGQHGESQNPIDRPQSGHLGRHIPFDGLPPDCRELVMRDYCDLWDALPPEQNLSDSAE